MAFPSANTAYVWRMNTTDCAIGVLDYSDSDTIFLDRFLSIEECEANSDDAVARAQSLFPDMAVEFIGDTATLASIDQISAELRNAAFGEDELENSLKLSL